MNDGSTEKDVEVRVDGELAALHPSEVPIRAGSQELVLRFGPRPGRAAFVRLDGTLLAPPPQAPVGNALLERRLVKQNGRFNLLLKFRPAQSARNLRVEIPLPGGLALSPAARPPTGARLARREGDILLLFDHLDHPVSAVLPLDRVAGGHFAIAPATLRAARPEQGWAVTEAETIDLP